MNFRIRRRRFAQLALVSTTATLIANFTNKAVAQKSKFSTIYGFKIKKDNNKQSDLENSTPATVITSLNVVTGETVSTVEVPASNVENANKPSKAKKKAVFAEPRERLTDATVTSDGTIILSSVVSSQNGDVPRIIIVDGKNLKLKKALKLSGFKGNNYTVESLQATKDGKLLSVISRNAGVPPFNLATIDLARDEVNSSDELGLPFVSPTQRISNLTQSPDGKIYATFIDLDNPLTLVELDLNYKSPATGKGRINKLVELSFNKKNLSSDLSSLAFSASGQLFALGNLNRGKTNSLFTLDIKTGELFLVKEFDANKIVFSPL